LDTSTVASSKMILTQVGFKIMTTLTDEQSHIVGL